LALWCASLVVPAVALLATALLSGCGSTVPTQPSAAVPSAVGTQPPAPTFASLIGNWGGKVQIALLYSNPLDPTLPGLGSSHCDASAYVNEHTATALVGHVGFKGTSLNSDKECGSGFDFSATMGRDGTFTTLRFTSAGLASFECYPASAPVFKNGSADSNGFRVMLVDTTICRWPPLTFTNNQPTRDTERTFTVVVDLRRSGPLPPS
jgi:hypothetical protein